jgi:hypothetical protein
MAASPWKAVLVVADHVFGRSPILQRQSRAPSADFQQLLAERSAAWAAKSREALAQRLHDGHGEAFAGRFSDLTRQSISLWVLDA